MGNNYLSAKTSSEEAAHIAMAFYNIRGNAIPLDGEIDYNFRIKTAHKSYLLKISRPGANKDFIDFQVRLLAYLDNANVSFNYPQLIPDLMGNPYCIYKDDNQKQRFVRLLSWLPGRPWSKVNPQSESLLRQLGHEAGMLTAALSGFDHSFAHRDFDWDIAHSAWTCKYTEGFGSSQKKMLKYFQDAFETIQPDYRAFRKSLIHNDVNDNNIVVNNDWAHPSVVGIIDYGDAIYTQSINDLAVVIAYGMMGHADPLQAVRPLLMGYHEEFPLLEEELKVLYVLVGMRLVISLSKSHINKKSEPDNAYLLISEKAALESLERWMDINPDLAHYYFREACGFSAHPAEHAFKTWADKQKISIHQLLPDVDFAEVTSPDLSVGGNWLGLESEFNDTPFFGFQMNQLRQANPRTLIAGG